MTDATTAQSRDEGRTSLLLSAWAWGLLLGSWALGLVLPGDGPSQAVRSFIPIAAIAFLVLAVLAIARAGRARRSRSALAGWAIAVAVLDALGLLAALLAVGVVIWLITGLASCSGTCLTF